MPMSKLLQLFADLTGEKILIRKIISYDKENVTLSLDTAPLDVDEAIRLIIVALGAEHYEILPLNDDMSMLGLRW